MANTFDDLAASMSKGVWSINNIGNFLTAKGLGNKSYTELLEIINQAGQGNEKLARSVGVETPSGGESVPVPPDVQAATADIILKAAYAKAMQERELKAGGLRAKKMSKYADMHYDVEDEVFKYQKKIKGKIETVQKESIEWSGKWIPGNEQTARDLLKQLTEAKRAVLLLEKHLKSDNNQVIKGFNETLSLIEEDLDKHSPGPETMSQMKKLLETLNLAEKTPLNIDKDNLTYIKELQEEFAKQDISDEKWKVRVKWMKTIGMVILATAVVATIALLCVYCPPVGIALGVTAAYVAAPATWAWGSAALAGGGAFLSSTAAFATTVSVGVVGSTVLVAVLSGAAGGLMNQLGMFAGKSAAQALDPEVKAEKLKGKQFEKNKKEIEGVINKDLLGEWDKAIREYDVAYQEYAKVDKSENKETKYIGMHINKKTDNTSVPARKNIDTLIKVLAAGGTINATMTKISVEEGEKKEEEITQKITTAEQLKDFINEGIKKLGHEQSSIIKKKNTILTGRYKGDVQAPRFENSENPLLRDSIASSKDKSSRPSSTTSEQTADTRKTDVVTPAADVAPKTPKQEKPADGSHTVSWVDESSQRSFKEAERRVEEYKKAVQSTNNSEEDENLGSDPHNPGGNQPG